ncbi:MAG: phage GP46 family protein [Pseudodesulfovibrio sp.]|uniref:GP46 family protein n=1 Tax=Pseudodesulfovibrio aespoeensis (strain ATCC 700646 / DSM 10631 / Aspo-2) TaxID=643562 RepID=E6VU86_PSEA9|nr:MULTISPECIES: phage GP46 family protein [Pseudodesulfovibrio]MBU4191327.1 phage GP46 family protein [Pseudomonadota bacterium]ADU63393.1 GP46 family protein [Pseudodesulfovibrio aespoeensis Aspo-2]MBU4243441.1 phage GP46 family protein [Pseudomonadota bacterium]MBU4377471.1 phage GP46 family protein [Pseudomonadota bacterium]MBU4473775.1 phage GP46 family protein [Pseudomonadota bacterium]
MDVRLIWKEMGADLALEGLDLVRDDGLQTAVVLSLFIDRRAEADDVIPDGTGDRRGWWGDTYPDIIGDKYGSRLWLLSREKQLPRVLVRARAYAEEALAWMLDDGVARAVRVEASFVRTGVLGLRVVIERTDGSDAVYTFATLWEA